MGMPHGDIPNLLGRVLSGTKYGIKQTRGKFGLGAKMALIWSKMSTGGCQQLPSLVRSCLGSSSHAHVLVPAIDVAFNIHRAAN